MLNAGTHKINDKEAQLSLTTRLEEASRGLSKIWEAVICMWRRSARYHNHRLGIGMGGFKEISM